MSGRSLPGMAFCPGGIFRCGILSGGILSVTFFPVAFCPVALCPGFEMAPRYNSSSRAHSDKSPTATLKTGVPCDSDSLAERSTHYSFDV